MQAQIPAAVYSYFGMGDHPTIAQTFTPGVGWKNYSGTKRVSRTWAKKLRAQGVTVVALRQGERVADFSIKEVVR